MKLTDIASFTIRETKTQIRWTSKLLDCDGLFYKTKELMREEFHRDTVTLARVYASSWDIIGCGGVARFKDPQSKLLFLNAIKKLTNNQ